MFIPSQRNLWKPYILRPKNLFKLAVFLLIVKFVIFSWAYYFTKTSDFANVVSSELVEMVNAERTANGLKPLNVNPQLIEAAQNKALDMLNNDYFAHFSPMGTSPWFWVEKSGYKYVAAGENLAKDFTESAYVHEAWMDSPSHKANILNGNYQDIGIAVVEGEISGQKTILAVQFFGKSSVKKVISKVAVAAEENKVELPVVPDVKGEETALKGPEVFKEKGVFDFNKIVETPKNLINILGTKTESQLQEVYFIILGIISLILMLAIFINIKVQYPKMILMVLIFLVLIAALTLFNGGAILNGGIKII